MQFSLPHRMRVRLHSRNIPLSRAGKMRAAWFLLGTGFGIACNSALTPVTLPTAGTLASLEITPPQVAPSAVSTPEAVIAAEAPQAPIAAAAVPIETTTSASAITPPAAPEAPAATSSAAAEPVPYPRTEELLVASGDTFVTLLGKAGISTQEAHEILGAMGKKFNPRSLNVNDKMSITIDKPSTEAALHVSKLSLALSKTATLQVVRDKKGAYLVSVREAPTFKKLARAGGKINSSLYETIVGSGMPVTMVGEIIKAYSYDVDFQREIHSGDTVDIVFEKNVTEDGKLVSYGKIVYAALDLGDRDLRIYRYTDNLGTSDYYTMKGESVRKALLRTPINGARISSGFGMREHPILGYSKMHKGVDFAAPTGTPIYAAGDGVVSFVGRKGGYGNYLQIKHNAQYGSAYAHLSRFATGIAPGKKIKQGQVIAYVGSTGASTGPHLHYEILKQGAQVNPANVKFKTGTMLAGNQLKSFKRSVASLHAQLDLMKTPSGKMAMLDLPAAPTN